MSKTENINIMSSSSNDGSWAPEYGEESEKLLNKIFGDDADAKEKVKEETYHIMKLCGNPNDETNTDTGLVFGYVQSGKTLSFTTLTALARDNSYQIVILLAGISTNLVNQSFNRLQNDLDINQGFHRKWVMLKNPQDPIKNPQDKNTIQRELQNWNKQNIPEGFKKTLLITVMKETNHLRNLMSVLKKLDLSNVPTLIIDDEGDQASMNTKASANAKRAKESGVHTEQEMSTIYSRIRSLKSILPHHTFIQYTATPQAPLFINILDNLSPNFIQLLTPGKKYTGGRAFCQENHFIIRRIPYSEIYSEKNSFEEAPETLQEAMRIFFLSVTSGRLYGDKKGNPKNRSMMVHPSRLVDEHETYYNWVIHIKNFWEKVFLEYKDDNESREQVIAEFKNSYKDLKSTAPGIQSFDELLETIGYNISSTAVEQLNSKSGSSVAWNSNYSFILVGGQAMDRGFTVEGLTITYMPRSKGVGNADTIQQRARFFGYKKDFLGHCRVYLDAENIHLFSEYVNHEEDIRKKLLEHKLSGQHLNEMERRFVLNEMFRLTRTNVLSEDLTRTTFGNKWVRIRAPHDSEIIIESNRKVIKAFKEKYNLAFKEDDGHKDRTPEQKHLVAKIPLKELFQDLLNKLKFTRQTDSTTYTNLKSVIDLYTDEFPPEDSFVYLIAKGNPRTRRLKKDEIQQLFQGKNPRTGEIIYPGDEKIKSEDAVTVQVHNLNFRDTEHEKIITIAVWVPARLSQSLISKIND
ncbi:Z1 domain-containing protein [Formosa sp. PL04]|uniref:Z1 domain-containing protein n=1 Tax=Formosa sp. PL04 TaxID=3081755 RepID=UPI002982816C|nr:Z1 domain-containing protein [Formosa sp. PL04]MDW5289274.1 Z1 domain-containing protein [Formosa sp. PL04]